MGAMRRKVWMAFALGSLAAAHAAFAEPPTTSPVGQFECRDWDTQPTVLLASFLLRGDGTYEATDKVPDLTAHRPSTTGQYRYDEPKEKIYWTSGDWQNRVGSYMPRVKGTDFVVIHTTRDPEGKVDGVLRCARTPNQR